jgi:hypothetical protein
MTKLSAITGSWKLTNSAVEQDVRTDVRGIFASGGGIVTGGAPGVDFFAMDEAIKADPSGERIRVVLPIPLSKMVAHFRKRVAEGVIGNEHRIEDVIAVLEHLHTLGPDIVTDVGFEIANQDSYYARHHQIIALASDVYAYQVNGSGGVQDTVDKAREKGIPVYLRSYTL